MISVKSLGDGQLAATIGDLYVVPANTTAIVRSVMLVNTDSGSRTVNLYFKKSGGTARRLITKDKSLAAGESVALEAVLTLAAGDAIQGDASSAAKVDYSVFGVERT